MMLLLMMHTADVAFYILFHGDMDQNLMDINRIPKY